MHTVEKDTETMKIKPNQKDKSLVAKHIGPQASNQLPMSITFTTKKRKQTGTIFFEWLESSIRVIEDIYHTKVHRDIVSARIG